MNDGNGGSRGRCWRGGLRRAAWPAAAMAGTALLVAACGGGSSPAVAGSTAYQKAVAFAQCMRVHGEPGWPDPDSKGNFFIDGRKDHLNGSRMQSATRACQHLDPVSQMTSAQQRQITSQALKFVACMRAHGLPNMADPVVNANGVQMHLPAGVRPGSPQLKFAQQACRSLMPGGGS